MTLPINCHSRAGGNPATLSFKDARLLGNEGLEIYHCFPGRKNYMGLT